FAIMVAIEFSKQATDAQHFRLADPAILIFVEDSHERWRFRRMRWAAISVTSASVRRAAGTASSFVRSSARSIAFRPVTIARAALPVAAISQLPQLIQIDFFGSQPF